MSANLYQTTPCNTTRLDTNRRKIQAVTKLEKCVYPWIRNCNPKLRFMNSHWPLVPKFAGSNRAKAVGFLGAKKSSARLPSEGK